MWWLRNLASCDSAGSKQSKKSQVGVPPGLVWGKGGEGVVWFSVCGVPLGDWGNGISFDVTYGEYGFSLREVGPILDNGYGI